MAIPIFIPRLGWNMEEGVFGGWLKHEGEEVRAGDALFILETEKATEDVECLDTGILHIPSDGPQQGEKLLVGAVIGYLVEAGETAPIDRVFKDKAVARFALEHARTEPAVKLKESQEATTRPTISPRARRIARELGIDWTQLRGSGRTGRIRERDIRVAVAGTRASQRPQGSALPLSPIRKAIADHLLTSVRSTAAVTLTTTADAVNLVNLRQQFKMIAQAGHDLVPGYTDFFVKLAAAALQQHPLLNACWIEDRIVLVESIHIGIAVDTEAGLFVPVIRDVPALSLRQLAARSADLIERARQRKLSASELQGGTFTVTNLGPYGIDAFTPIIHCPQCAILGVGRIQRRPVVFAEQIVAREQVTLSLTFDHRIVDGAPAARYLQRLSQLIENPGPTLMP